jgi:hypothetical protein
MNVHVLASVLSRDLIENTLLVFKTIRVGFPSADILVVGNDLDTHSERQVEPAVRSVAGSFRNTAPTDHSQWIEALIRDEVSPFWICDTDMVFHRAVEDWFPRPAAAQLFAGRYEPEFFERWTQSQHVARLHPSLMWFNPRPLRAAIRAWPGKHPFFNSVEKTLIRWTFIPVAGKLCFYDTCAGLHHALGGELFTQAQNEAFTHRFCGTYSNLVGASDDQLRIHEAVCKALSPA